jgi:hypothetical protein
MWTLALQCVDLLLRGDIEWFLHKTALSECSWTGVVSMLNMLWPGRSKVLLLAGARMFFVSKCPDNLWASQSVLCIVYWGILLLEVEWLGCELKCCILCSVRLQNESVALCVRVRVCMCMCTCVHAHVRIVCVCVPYTNPHFWTDRNQTLHTSPPWSGRDHRACMGPQYFTFPTFLIYFVGSGCRFVRSRWLPAPHCPATTDHLVSHYCIISMMRRMLVWRHARWIVQWKRREVNGMCVCENGNLMRREGSD